MPVLHSVWPGNNRFYCGCCVSGPSREIGGIIYLQFCMICLLVPYCIFVLSKNWNITPALPVILFLLFAVTELFLFLTSCTDPGIIPRRPFLRSNPVKFKYLLEG